MKKKFDEGDIIKIMLLGYTTVGKTCFIIKYVEGTFREIFLSSIGVDYLRKTLKIKDKNYNLCIYDTAGQERFKSLSFNTIKMAHGIILMYDITNIESFNILKEWIKNAKESKGNDFPMILLGNKLDLEEKRKVSKEEGEKLANEYDIYFLETSNKDGTNVNEAVIDLVKKIIVYGKYAKKDLNTSSLNRESLAPRPKTECC